MKSKYFIRYKLIIEKMQRSQRVTYEEMETYMIDTFKMMGHEFSYSIRTFQRDKKDIYNIFGLQIINDRTDNSYYVDESHISEGPKSLYYQIDVKVKSIRECFSLLQEIAPMVFFNFCHMA